MFRCHHCGDLHVLAVQARECAGSAGAWFTEVLLEVDRILERGPVVWSPDPAREPEWTASEHVLWQVLRATLGDAVRSHWWVPACQVHVDFFVPAVSLAIEIERDSGHRTGADRLRSGALRSHGVEVLRVPRSLATRHPDRIAALVAARLDAGSLDLGPYPTSLHEASTV